MIIKLCEKRVKNNYIETLKPFLPLSSFEVSKMAEEWLTIPAAAGNLGISVRTLHRRLADGVFETKEENGRKYVLLPDDSNDDRLMAEKDAMIEHLNQVISEKDNLVTHLTQQLENLQKTLDEALQESGQSRERSDTIILTLTNQLEQHRLLLEDLRNRKKMLQRVKSWFGFQVAESQQSGGE